MNFLFNRSAHGVDRLCNLVDLVETVCALLWCAHREVEGDAAKAIAEVELDVAPVPCLVYVIIGNAGSVFNNADDERRILRITVEEAASAYMIFCTLVLSHTFPF